MILVNGLVIISDAIRIFVESSLIGFDGGLCGVGLGYQRGQLLFLGELVKLRCAEQGELFLFGQEVLGVKIIGVEVLGIILVGIVFLNLVQHISGASGGTGDLTGGAVGHALFGIVNHLLRLYHLLAGIF